MSEVATAVLALGHGSRRAAVLPFFLFPEAHVESGSTAAMEDLRHRYPDVEFAVAGLLGDHPGIVEIAAGRVQEALG